MNLEDLKKKNEELKQELSRLKLRKKELEMVLNKITSAKAFKLWQGYNKIKKFIVAAFDFEWVNNIKNKVRRVVYLFLHDRKLLYIMVSIKFKKFPVYYIKTLYLLPYCKKKIKNPDIIIPFRNDENIFFLLDLLFDRYKYDFNKVICIDDCSDKQFSKKVLNHIMKIRKKYKNKILYFRNKRNRGFIYSVNYGVYSSDRDIILINSDVIPVGNWINNLKSIAYSKDEIATVTPLSNNATIFSIPHMNENNEDSNPSKTAELVERVYTHTYTEVPTSHGFCMFVKRKYIDKFGFFDYKTYGVGYGEENDLSMRFYRNGLLNVSANNTYVKHIGSKTFGSRQRNKLFQVNYPKLLKRYPEYESLVHKFIKNDPLRQTRELFAFFRDNRDLLDVDLIVVVHKNPFLVVGGVERETIELFRRASSKLIGVYFLDTDNIYTLYLIQNMRILQAFKFETNDSETIFRYLIKLFRPKKCVFEHLENHSFNYVQIAKEYGCKTIVFVHDFYFFCRTSDLINYLGKFCHYEKNIKICRECLKRKFKVAEDQSAWRKRAKQVLQKEADIVVFNSEFTRDTYIKILKLEKGKSKFVVSYPSI